MKTRVVLYILFIALSCKSNGEINNTCNEIESISSGRTIGKISHQYHKNGCQTVIILKNKQILAPIKNIDTLLDVDGLEVCFTYHPSRKVQTKECTYGIPVIINEIKRIKF
jgi:hypothetical protein